MFDQRFMGDSEAFRTFIAGGREFFICGNMKKDFPFPESLLRLLYFDVLEFDQLVQRMGKHIEAYYQSRDEKYLKDVLAELNELADFHVYFEFVRYEWQRKIANALKPENSNADLLDLLPRKKLTQLVTYIAHIQAQAKGLISSVLDKDGPHLTVEDACRTKGQMTYQFRTLIIRNEIVDSGEFTEVLYPETIYDLIDFSLCNCIQRGIQMRVCKNCGKYFALTGKGTSEYCNITLDEKGRSCKEVGAMRTYSSAKKKNIVFNEYRREYKRRFAWIKSGRIDSSTFYAWSAQAKQKEADCEQGKISLEEFKWWLEH